MPEQLPRRLIGPSSGHLATRGPLGRWGRWGLLLLSLLSLFNLGAGPPVLKGGRPGALRLYPKQLAAYRAATELPSLTAPAALLADSTTGQVLLTRNPHQRRPMASTTKLMTALLVREHARLNEEVVVPASALVGGASMGLEAGEHLTVEDLLWGLLLNSGNDAAVALAEHVAGSQAAFVELMNQRAATLGLRDTHFANPHGLDAPEHYSSVYDLWKLAEAVLADPVLRRMVATRSYNAAGHALRNRNELLSMYPGADGVKTGTTDQAGQCLVASVTRNGHRVIAVVLGSQDRYADVTALLDHYFTFYRWASAPQPQGLVAWLRAADGRPRLLRAADPPELFLPRWQWSLLRVQPVVTTNSTTVDHVRWYLGDQLLAEAPAALVDY